MSVDYTAADLICEVRAVAAERPDFVYSSQSGASIMECSYFGQAIGDPTGEPCIVGQAFKRLGGAPEGLLEAEGSESLDDAFLGTGIGYILERFEIQRTTEQAKWLAAVQRAQDTGDSWRFAVEHADEVHGEPSLEL